MKIEEDTRKIEKKMQRKINAMKSFFENTNKVAKCLPRLIQKEKK